MGTRQKSSYKVTNWREYNEWLVRRGNITLWFDEDALASWEHANLEVKRGRPFTYSDTAIECLLMLRELFRLPYRQTEGLGRALVELMGVEVPIPSFTLLAKRAAKLKIALDVSRTAGPIDVVVDSTGLKVVGEGEWRSAAYGTCRRKTWRKLHLSINPQTQEIVAEVLTSRSKDDAESVPALLDQVEHPVEKLYGDGAYDRWELHEQLASRSIAAVIPPRQGARIRQHGNSKNKRLVRDEAIRRIRRIGRSGWKREIGYHRRSLVETSMFRLKQAFGDHLKNRAFENQQTEARLRCKLLNHFTQLGIPKSTWNWGTRPYGDPNCADYRKHQAQHDVHRLGGIIPNFHCYILAGVPVVPGGVMKSTMGGELCYAGIDGPPRNLSGKRMKNRTLIRIGLL